MSDYILRIGHPTGRVLVAEAGSYSLTGQSAVLDYSGAIEGNDGLVISDFANYDPDDAPIISIDINNTIPNWGTYNGGNVLFANEPWWNGSSVPVATMYPPTIGDSGSGFGNIDLWKSGTKEIRQVNIRWEYKVSDAYCDDATQLPKLMILRSYTQLQPIPTVPADRPMLYFAHMQEASNASVDFDDALCLAVAQGTSRMFSLTNLVPGPTSADWVDGGNGPATYCSNRQPFYHRATSGTDLGGNPILATSEIVCVEMRVNVMSTTDEPNGIIAYRVYRQNGNIFERGCAWTWESGKTVGANYIADIDTFGGGYYNNANSGSASIYTKMGRKMTIGTNLNSTVGRSWIGPPTDFVTG